MGNASVSSMELVCSDCVPPRTAAKRLYRHAHDVVVGLLRGERDAGGLRVRAQHPALGILGAVTLAHQARPDPARGAELGDLLEEIVVHVPEEAEPRREVVDLHPALEAALDVAEAVGQREGELLHRRRARLADVVAGDAHRIPVGIVLGAVLDRVDDELKGGEHRKEPLLLRDVFLENVVLKSAAHFLFGHALLFGDRQVHRQDHDGRAVDGHGGRDFAEGNAGEQLLHILERGDGDAAFADLAFGFGAVGVVAHERGHVESGGEPGLALLEQELEALVGFLRRREPGELAHRPEFAAVHVALDAAREGIFAREAEVAKEIETCSTRPARDPAASTAAALPCR